MSRPVRWTLLGLFLLLLLVRISLPFFVRDYVNHQLNQARDYGGRLGGIELQLWRGQYSIRSLQILKKTGGIPAPLFSVERMDLSIEWRELLHGSVVGKVIMHQPHLNFVIGPDPDQTQTGREESWNKILESLFPFKLNRLEITDGEIHFQNPHSTPPVDIYLEQLSATATNFANSRDLKTELPAGVTARATALGGGGLDLRLQINPVANDPTFQLDASLTNVDLTSLNGFLKAYGKFDVEHGVFALYSSAAAKNGKYEGYFKIFFDHLKVFQWEKDKKKDALEIFWQAVVGTLTTVLKNQPHDQLATRVPFSGSYQQDRKLGIWRAVATILRNAFVRALVPNLDEHITVKAVEKRADPREETSGNGTNNPATNYDKGAEKLMKPEAPPR